MRVIRVKFCQSPLGTLPTTSWKTTSGRNRGGSKAHHEEDRGEAAGGETHDQEGTREAHRSKAHHQEGTREAHRSKAHHPLNRAHHETGGSLEADPSSPD